MTMLVGWVAVDQRSIASAYIASDSRFTWYDNAVYDYGRKVFACKYSADIFAYCGEVLFSSVALGRIVNMIDAGLLYEHSSTSAERNRAIAMHLKQQFSLYPKHVIGDSVQVYHISRDLDASFHLYRYSIANDLRWKNDELPIERNKSNVIFTAGIGKSDFDNLYQQYSRGISSNTSRNVFQCFCDCLLHQNPVKCGGPPQLVGLYRVADSAPKEKRNGMDFGIIIDQKRYFLGAEVDNLQEYDIIRWYNPLFEICDGNTLCRKVDAMPQPNPLLSLATP